MELMDFKGFKSNTLSLIFLNHQDISPSSAGTYIVASGVDRPVQMATWVRGQVPLSIRRMSRHNAVPSSRHNTTYVHKRQKTMHLQQHAPPHNYKGMCNDQDKRSFSKNIFWMWFTCKRDLFFSTKYVISSGVIKQYQQMYYVHDLHLLQVQNLSQHMCQCYLENKRRQFWFCCHMLSGNGQARPYLGVVDATIFLMHLI